MVNNTVNNKENSIVNATNKKDTANSKNVPYQDNPLYVNTVIKTSNPDEVKGVIDVLISQQGCLPVEE